MMSSPSKKFKTNKLAPLSDPQTDRFSTEIPPHLIFTSILPRLSYKCLSRFKCVSKTWNKIISTDATFAEEQSLCASPLSRGIVFSQCYGNKVQFFNTFDSPIGFDQCQHPLFANRNLLSRRILASSCGLLCILFHEYADFAYQINSFYVYVGNLATEVGEVIPLRYQTGEHNIGLAFDPSIEPDCYQLVQPHWHYQEHEYEFDVYSTKICEWVRSKQRLTEVKSFYRHKKPVTLKNIVYWDCYESMISFDPWKDVASYIEIPKHDKSSCSDELGTCNGRITWTRITSKSMEVYMLDESEKVWEMQHRVSFEMMFNSNHDVLLRFWHSLGKTSDRFRERLFLVTDVYPFPYEGGDKLFFRVSTKKGEFILSYDLKLEKVSKFCEFQVMNKYPVLQYDRDYADNRNRADQRVFTYHNSMVKVPICQASKCQKIIW